LLVRIAEKAGISIFRGSLTSVLDRFVQCSADLGDHDIVVRATADNPLPNGYFVDALLEKFGEVGGNYLGTSWPDDGLPHGLSAEVMTVGALRQASVNTNDAYDCEHVTPWLCRQARAAGHVRRGWLIEKDFSHLRATIDTLEDYLAMASVFGDVEHPIEERWEELVPKLPTGELAAKNIPCVQRDGETYGNIMLGTAQLGLDYGIANRSGKPTDTVAMAILALAVKSGITHLDTARAYGDSESRIGQMLPASARATVKIVTKLQPLESVPANAAEREVNSAVDASVYGSCRDLRREKLDVLMFHRSADIYRWQGAAIDRLEHHVARGVIGALGVSVYAPDEATKCLLDNRIKHLQIPFNLFDSRWLDAKYLSALAQRPDVCVHARSVFLQGLLINRAETWPSWVPQRHELVQRIEEMVSKYRRQNAADLCMAYVRSFPWVTTVVLGVEAVSQLDELLSLAFEPELSVEQALEAQANFSDIPARLLNPSQW
jgi:spore coat polysaccharide biosynthesis protein SpsF